MHKYPGKLIVVEGPDACGKTTQLDKIAENLRATGIEVVVTREPGGTPLAEELRRLSKQPVDKGEIKHPLTELLMMYAARNQHMFEVIVPALRRGAVVLSDRFNMSSYVYQVLAGGLSPADYHTVNHLVLGDFQPDLTLVFNVSAEVAHARLLARNDGDQARDHFDEKDEAYKLRVRESYADLSVNNDPYRNSIIAIDANVEIDQVFAQVLPHLMAMVNVIKKRPEFPYEVQDKKPYGQEGYLIDLPSTTISTASAHDIFRITVDYRDGSKKHVVSIDDRDRVELDTDSFMSVSASKLKDVVSETIRCLDMKQRDGILQILVQAHPYGPAQYPIAVDATRTLKI